VHAWDEAVAFYTGSLEGASQGGNNGLDSCIDGNCELLFMLADKRCTDFGTCTADYDGDDFAGYSKLNFDVFALFTTGRDKILGAYHTLECQNIEDTMNEIAGLMLIPFIQGVQRYLYKTSVPAIPTAKEAGELFAFASVVLPFIDRVDSDAAEMLYNRAWLLDYTTDDWKDIKYALEDTYPSLGLGAGVGKVTCAMVGELTDSGVVLSEQCIDPVHGGGMKILILYLTLTIVLTMLFLGACLFGISMRRKYQSVLRLHEADDRADERLELTAKE